MFVSYTQFVDEQGKALAIVRLVKGLDGSGGGRAREGTVDSPIELPLDQWAKVRKVVASARTEDRCRDRQFWDKVAQQAGVAALKFFATGTPPDAGAEMARLNENMRAVCR